LNDKCTHNRMLNAVC